MKYRLWYSIENDTTYLRVGSMYVTRFGNLREAFCDDPVSNNVQASDEGREIKASAIRGLRSSMRKFIRKRGTSLTYKKAEAIFAEHLRHQGLRIVT